MALTSKAVITHQHNNSVEVSQNNVKFLTGLTYVRSSPQAVSVWLRLQSLNAPLGHGMTAPLGHGMTAKVDKNDVTLLAMGNDTMHVLADSLRWLAHELDMLENRCPQCNQENQIAGNTETNKAASGG